jgi:hypothetical protein
MTRTKGGQNGRQEERGRDGARPGETERDSGNGFGPFDNAWSFEKQKTLSNFGIHTGFCGGIKA